MGMDMRYVLTCDVCENDADDESYECMECGAELCVDCIRMDNYDNEFCGDCMTTPGSGNG